LDSEVEEPVRDWTVEQVPEKEEAPELAQR
jgi:hypothetical protein